MKKIIKYTLCILYFLVFVFFTLNFEKSKEKEERKNVQGEQIAVTAKVKLVGIDFVVHPEKRVPKTNNWSTFVYIKIKDKKDNQVYFFDTDVTNKLGEGSFSLNPDQSIPRGTHIVTVKGISHLSKKYTVKFDKQFENLNFTIFGDLLAGDTHKSSDNLINSLDISTLMSKLNTKNYASDLNQDNTVNSLDLSIQLYNLGKSGEV